MFDHAVHFYFYNHAIAYTQHKLDFVCCMRWPFMPGSHIGLFRLQCVCSPCVVRKRCRSSTDCAFTQESATDLWLFTTNTTFIHYFDFKSKHCHWKCFFSIVIIFFTPYSNTIFHRYTFLTLSQTYHWQKQSALLPFLLHLNLYYKQFCRS